MKKAFTLAEVLITLGIIGVIAALTLPGLIQGYRKKVTETALKKAYTQLYQALEQAQTDNGEAINWNWEDYQTYDRDSAEAFLQEYFYPYFNIIGRSAVQQHKDKLKYVIYNFNDDYSGDPNWFWNNPQLTNWAELSDGSVISFVLKNLIKFLLIKSLLLAILLKTDLGHTLIHLHVSQLDPYIHSPCNHPVFLRNALVYLNQSSNHKFHS